MGQLPKFNTENEDLCTIQLKCFWRDDTNEIEIIFVESVPRTVVCKPNLVLILEQKKQCVAFLIEVSRKGDQIPNNLE